MKENFLIPDIIISPADYLRESLAILNPYSVEVRYPGDAWIPSMEDTEEARQAAQEV